MHGSSLGFSRFSATAELVVARRWLVQGRVHDSGVRADTRSDSVRRRGALGAGRSVHDDVRHSHSLLPVRHAGLPDRTRYLYCDDLLRPTTAPTNKIRTQLEVNGNPVGECVVHTHRRTDNPKT